MLFQQILVVFFFSSTTATSVDLTIIERIRACGERLGNNNSNSGRIPKICYSNPDAQGSDFQTSRNLARGKRSNLLFRGHHPTCSKPCQRSSLFMDPNLLGLHFGIYLNNYDGSKYIDIGSCRGNCAAYKQPFSGATQGCTPMEFEPLEFLMNDIVFTNEMIVKTCRCASFLNCHS